MKNVLCKILAITLLIYSIICIIDLKSIAYAKKIDILHYDGVDHQYTGPEVTLILNQKLFEGSEDLMQPIILENRTLVPVREVFETLGGTVDWDANERRVDVTLGNKNISLWIDKTETMVDGVPIETDVPAKIINSKTMVPARFISEQGKLLVDWDDTTKTVSITTPTTNIKSVEYTQINQVNCVVVTTDSIISGYKYFMLEEPYRLILDVENSNFQIDTKEQQIDDDLISTIRFGEQEESKNRIVLDLKKDTDYIVVPSKDRMKLYFAMAEEFSIPNETIDNPNQGSNVENESTSGDIENNGSTGNENNTGNSENTGSISGDNNTENNGTNGSTSGENNDENINGSGENSSTENSGDDSSGDEEQNIVIPDVYITSVKYSTISKRVKIGYDGDIEYKSSFLTNPNRIVMDIESAELKADGPKEINPKGNVITSIRFSQYEENTVRVVVELSEKVDYKVYERSSEIQISVSQPTYKNVSYKLNASNVQITLVDVDLDDLSASANADSDEYTIRFSSKDFDCGNGTIEPEDEFVEKIKISSSKIVISSPDEMDYSMRQSGSNVIITIKERSESSTSDEVTDRKVILIDAGHGGYDPGACNGSEQEKVYNLNIALMLYDLLSERDDVTVYITRDSDIYLSREDRISIAEEINPNLIVSVHNNSLENKAYTGTMVLYYNKDTESNYGDVTSRECAQIVLNKLVSALGTVNRGVVNREDLHILSKTSCPSILCEVCFISNDEELERLKTETFQQNAAQAIYDGVVEILEIM